jgi:hypothetical protein
VKLLLGAGANVHAWNDDALRWASVRGHPTTVKLLEAAVASAAAVSGTRESFREMGVELTQEQALKVSAFLAARPVVAARPQTPAP